MFSFFNDTIAVPSEIVALGILPQLSIQDLVAFRSVSKHSKTLSEDNTALQTRIFEEFGIHVHGTECALKYAIHHSFKKGIHLLCGANKNRNKKLLQLATKYLSMTKSLIDQLDLIHPTDKPWVEFMHSYMHLCGIGFGVDTESETEDKSQQRIKIGMENLMSAANAGHTNAKLLLAYIYMQNPSDYALLFGKVYYMALNLKEDIFSDNNSHNEEGIKHLISVYNLPDAQAELMHTALLNKDQATLQDVLTFLSEKGHAHCTLTLAELAPISDSDRRKKALRLYQTASTQGSLEATLARLSILTTGTLNGINIRVPTPFDLGNAVECLQTATAQGSSYAAFHLGTLHLKGACKLQSVNLTVPGPINISAALKYFERGTKSITDHDFQSAGKCAFALASHFYAKGDLKKAFEWYKKGAELGHFECTLEAGYLCLHHHAELHLLNGPKTADGYFEDALILQPAAEEVIMTRKTTPHQNPADAIAGFFTSHQDAEKHKNLNLQQYIKWKLRATASGYIDALINLRALFQEKGQKFSDRKSISIQPSFMFDVSVLGAFVESVEPIEKPFNLDICNAELSERIHAIYCARNRNPQTIIDLARQCYEALSLPVIEDEYLVKLARPHQDRIFGPTL